ncbi:MAG TPA: helix-turn-helix domain-containing protein [Actinomycetota bacterium]|nr:helix-turn-helix domain-containing protein [Actinomycetota bacterium]
MEGLLTAEQVGELLGVSRKRVYDLAAVPQAGFNRKLPSVRWGVRGLRFDPADVRAWIDEHKR